VNSQPAGDDEGDGRVMQAPCPFCGSSKVMTASEKKVDSSTYWRCETCGQMWNVGRLKVSGRRGYEGR
jgi:transposase-like protein